MRIQNVLVLLVLVALCAAGYFLLVQRSGDGEGSKLPSVWPKFDRSDVTMIEMKGQGDTLRLKRREGPGDRWDVLVGTEFLRADANAVDDLLAALSRQNVRDRVLASDVRDGGAQYGLVKDTVDVKITHAGPEPIQLRYGSLSRQGGSVYMDDGPGTDVWVVPRDAFDLVIAGISGGMRAKRLFDSTLHDVETLEVEKGGVTHAQVTRDASYVWKIRQPFQGYAHPTKFETELNRIVNVELEKWEEIGAVDLVKYGLDTPKWTVRVTPKGEGREPEVLLLGADDANGVFVMEEGTKVVARAPRRFFEAVTIDPMDYRDRSFSRFGIGDATIDVSVRGQVYKLEKGHAQTDVVMGPDRHPADGDKVNAFLDSIREWQTAEFRDGMKPEDAGIDGTQFIELTRITGGRETDKVALLIGADAPDGPGGAKRVYGQRKGDGGVEVVEAGPLAQAARGPQQFRRLDAATWPVDAIARIEREKGFGPDGEKIPRFRIERDVDGADKGWRFVGGQTGSPDGAVLNDMIDELRKIVAVEWLPFSSETDNATMGFKPPLGETMTLTVHLANYIGTADADPKLYVGKKRPAEQGGGYYARIPGKDGTGSWAFILAEDVVEKLKLPLSKD